MSVFKQTWWDENLPHRIEEFTSWIGSKDAESKVYCRRYVKDRGFGSLIDLGCGTATEYFAYVEEYPQLKYTGVDSCKHLFEKNAAAGVPMILAPAEETGLPDNFADVTFSRHVLEHQPKFEPVLTEMIRLARLTAIHVFFITPTNATTHVGLDSTANLYHNRYNIQEIESYLNKHKQVLDWDWEKINGTETALIIHLIK